jgi:hypothetical protein
MKQKFSLITFSFFLATFTNFSILPQTQNFVRANNHKKAEHKMIEIPEGKPVPQVDLVVSPDTMTGWNLHIKTNNFKFAPEKVNQESAINEGHAHLYVNGKKVTRIYSNWYYLSELEKGNNQIQVTLNTNKHEDLAYQGKIIEDSQTIQVP